MGKVNYGYFSNDGKEYVITEAETPLPFVNYFWNDRFISGVSQHMAGIGCFTERPLQYMHHKCRCLMVRDENRHFYLRDEETGEIWSPGWYPVLQKLDSYICRHGLGYSILESSFRGIITNMRVFVPMEEPVEIWKISLKNTCSYERKIKIFSFVDWLLKGYEEYADYHSCLHAEFIEEKSLLMCFNEASERPHEYFNGFVASNITPTGFDSSRKSFMGYGQVDRPKAVIEGNCSNSLAVCEKLVGALEHTIYLKPQEETDFYVVFGAAASLSEAEVLCDNLFTQNVIENKFNAVIQKINDDYSKIEVSVPEIKLNYLFNYWIKRAIQLHTEVGTDTGKGFRDILQAAWAVSSYDPEGARRKITESLQYQYSDGHTLRGWNPVDTHHYSDGPVWIAPAVDSYLKETGDYSLLSELVPYFDKGEATVWEHILTGIRHSTEDIGYHGLIKAHYGDWNDSLNGIGIKGKGVSNWTTIAMIFSINTAIEIAKNVLKDEAAVYELQQRADKLKEAVNKFGWDGSWYLEGINDAGEKVGSHEETEGYIYLNPQTWAIMAGIVDNARMPMVLNSIDNILECDYGSLVLHPAYKKPNPSIGRITYFVPGMWENASPYCHGTSFKVVADTYLKRGNEAFRSMMKVLPDSEFNPSSHSGCPPYIVTNMYFGPEHARKGQILYSWITGTSDWMFKALTSHIIGISANYCGLLVDPCIPSHWREFKLKREFFGAVYDIEFKNPNGRQSGVVLIELDGRTVEGNILPVFGDGKTHKVKVTM